MAREDSQAAESLMGFSLGDRQTQPLRTAAVYASLFEEDPFLHEALGLLALLESARAACLAMGIGYFDDPLWQISDDTQKLLLPAVLAFRAGEIPEGPLGPPFQRLGEARALRRADPPQAAALARSGAEALLAELEVQVVQPALGPMPALVRRSFGPYLSVTLPADEDAGGPRVLAFPEVDPGPLPVRQSWLAEVILPEWRTCLREQGRPLVARLRRIQIKGWFSRADLPPAIPRPVAPVAPEPEEER